MSLKVVSYNVRGLGNNIKRKKLFTLLRTLEYDVIMLQETHCTENNFKIWRSEWKGEMYYSNGTSASCGVLTLFKKGLQHGAIRALKDDEGRRLILEAQIGNIVYTFANIYAPNRDKPYFFEQTFQQIQNLGSQNVILSGDFNLVLNPSIDSSYTNRPNNIKSLKIVKNQMEKMGLRDVWRIKNPETLRYTCFRSRPAEGSRIDMMLISEHMINRINSCNMHTSTMSDHDMVYLDLNTQEYPRGRGYWKLNALHLTDQEYKENIRKIVSETDQEYRNNTPALRWEMIKLKIQGYSIEFSKRKARQKNKRIEELQLKLDNVNNEIKAAPQAEVAHLTCASRKYKEELDTLLSQKVKSAAFRSKSLWYEQGERSSKFFFSLEKMAHDRKTITALRKNSSIITKDPKEILAEQESFYRKLYSKNTQVCFKLGDLPGPHLSPQQNEKLESEITMEELTFALNSMQDGKTPGCDGLVTEFY